MSVDGKVAIVTRGASGIGRASAAPLARHGARVIIADRNATEAATVCAAITSAGGSGDR